MSGFVGDIEGWTADNLDFRQVIYTAHHMQLVLMTLQSGEDIGEEVHETTDQFFRVEQGTGAVHIDGQETRIQAGMAIIVPAGARHNLINTGTEPLKLYTIYTPPQHADGTVHRTRAEAAAAEEHFSGQTTE